MIWIEFMGPSGVGKSYWFSKVLQAQPSLNPENLLVSRIKTSPIYKALPKKVKIYGYLAQCNFKKLFFQKLFIEAVELRINSRLDYSVDVIKLIDLFFDGISKRNLDSLTKIKLCEMYSKKVTRYLLYKYFFKDSDLYIAEDGIIHTNWGLCTDENLEETIPLPAAVLYLEGDSDYIFKNRKKRITMGNPTWFEVVLDEKNLLEYTKSYHILYSKNIAFLKKRNVEIAIINIDNYTKTRDIINKFKLLVDKF